MGIRRIFLLAWQGLANLIGVSAGRRTHGHIEQSKVDNAELVDKDARVVGSILCGNVVVSACAMIRDSELTGDVTIEPYVKVVDACIKGKVRIGYHSSFVGPNSDVVSRVNEITIGRYTSVARNVSIQEYNHKVDCLSTYYVRKNILGERLYPDIESKGSIHVGNDVWIGAHTVILSGVSIGNGTVIGANSVVADSVPDFAIAVGSPARVVRYRFESSIIQRLQELKWWNWSRGEIVENRWLFESELTHDLLDRYWTLAKKP